MVEFFFFVFFFFGGGGGHLWVEHWAVLMTGGRRGTIEKTLQISELQHVYINRKGGKTKLLC